MTTLAIHRETSQAIALPQPRVGPISIRPASLDGADLVFIDKLQKLHSDMVGFTPLAALEKRIKLGNMLVAENPDTTERIGYIMFCDRYLMRDELGIVYQLNVTPGKQRGLVGAALLKAAFERSAYGCRLYCCWCAQDLQANHFWESMGFVPIAFRAGSRGKAQGGRRKEQRMHIMWQRRIREGDTQTPYWFPKETNGGFMKEARIVLPIPPGTHWSDAKPVVLPGGAGFGSNALALPLAPASPAEVEKKPRAGERKPKAAAAAESKPKKGLWFAPPQPPAPPPLTAEEKKAAKAKAKAATVKPPREKFKNDPKHVEAARELRDRYTEQINAGLLLPPSACGKYDVSRQLEAAPSTLKQTPLLKAA